MLDVSGSSEIECTAFVITKSYSVSRSPQAEMLTKLRHFYPDMDKVLALALDDRFT